MKKPVLVAGIDQGTTATTVLLVDEEEHVHGRGTREIAQSFPAPGRVEHDPDALWRSVLEALTTARADAGGDPAAIGITNQRETTVLWERKTGEAVAPAIVWQDRRTTDACETLRHAGHEARVQDVTGLLIDPYFSATKIAWILDHVPGLRARAERGDIAFGTVDSFLIWRMSGGRAHVTDASNASRTLLFDLERGQWSDEMCDLFRVPRALLPAVRPSLGLLATTAGVPGVPDGTPITGCAGDQQAALYGQGCFGAGEAKCTFGTGSFLLMNVGRQATRSRHRLIGTVAWTIGQETTYALEGSAFVSGALVQWLRDGLGMIREAAEVEPLAASVPDAGGVTIVPALAGLGAPHWRPDARGMIAGLGRGTTRAHIARAALEAMALQNVDLVRAMEQDAGRRVPSLRVDGGAAANNLLMQIQADLLGIEIVRPTLVELTAVGAARLAAQGAGLMAPGRAPHRENDTATVFQPRMRESDRQFALERWRHVVGKA